MRPTILMQRISRLTLIFLLFSTALNAQTPTLIQDIYKGSSDSDPKELTIFDSTLYFTARQNLSNGRKLWQYTNDTATIVQEIRSGSSGSTPEYLTVWDSTLYFKANGDKGAELWQYDGDTATLVQDIRQGIFGSDPSFLTVFNDTLYFSADAVNGNEELWQYDGDTATLVQDIASSGGSEPEKLTVLNTKLFFITNNSKELWQYNGDTATRFKNVAPKQLTATSNKLFGVLNDQIWQYNGDSAYVVPGSDSLTGPEDLTSMGNTLYFEASDVDGIYGEELWMSKGDTVKMVQDITSGFKNSDPYAFTPMYNRTYFVTNKDELWKYNGDTAVVVQSFDPADDPYELTFLDSTLYFRAEDGTHGEELWKMDMEIECFVNTAVFVNDYPNLTITSLNSNASYQWVDCNKSFAPVKDSTRQTFEPATSGNYAVVVTKNNCTDTSSCYDVEVENTGLKSNEVKVNFSVYPNPAENKLNIIQKGGNNTQTLKIHTLTGETLKERRITGTHKLDVSELSPGVYIMEIQSEEAVRTKKVVIK